MEMGFKKGVDPIINHLSREPVYAAAVTREYKFLKPLIDNHMISEGDAFNLAEDRATRRVLPMIHNTRLRSQFSDIV